MKRERINELRKMLTEIELALKEEDLLDLVVLDDEVYQPDVELCIIWLDTTLRELYEERRDQERDAP